MSHSAPNASTPPRRPGRRAVGARARQAGIAGGLAAGTAFAAITGISIASTNRSQAQPTSGSRPSPPALPTPHGRSLGPLGAPGGPPFPGGPAGPGGPDSGTITAINGSVLTLRTENGTETVDTSSSTRYSKAFGTISFSDLHTGEIVSVVPAPPKGDSSAHSAGPFQPGTGTVKAATVMVVEPTFTGRVTSASNGTYSLVGPGGQLLTVTTNGSTRYDNASLSQGSASTIAVGDHVVAEGTQSDLTHLTADVIAIMPAPPAPPQYPAGAPTPTTTRSTPHARGASERSRSRVSSSRH